MKNAINLENIDWEMQDKSEVINKLGTYEACFTEGELETEPWEIEWGVAKQSNDQQEQTQATE